MTEKALTNLRQKLSVLKRYLPAKKAVEPVLITSNGLVPNKYSGEIHRHLSALDSLFLSPNP